MRLPIKIRRWLALGLLAFAALLLNGGNALAEEAGKASCIQPEVHEAVTVFLLDLTASVPLGSNFETSLDTLSNMLVPGERLLAALILDKRANTRVLVDIVKPKESIWDSKLAIRRKQKTFEQCLASLKDAATAEAEPTVASKSGSKGSSAKATVQASAILETIGFVEEIIRSESSPKKRLVIYSDMIQFSQLL